MSPELQAPLRTRQEAARDILVNLFRRETYIVFEDSDGHPRPSGFELGLTRGAVIRDLADGQYNHRIDGLNHGPIAVWRIGIGEPAEDVTESIARDLLDYLIRHNETHDDEGQLRDCPFLDWAMPEWELQVRKPQKTEQVA